MSGLEEAYNAISRAEWAGWAPRARVLAEGKREGMLPRSQSEARTQGAVLGPRVTLWQRPCLHFVHALKLGEAEVTGWTE